MRFLVASVSLLALAASGSAQPQGSHPLDTPLPVGASDARWEFDIVGRVSELSVQPGGRVWMGTMVGELYDADRIDGDWSRRISVPTDDVLMMMGGDGINRVSFFTASTAIATGYIDGPDGRAHDALLRTTDAGETWERVQLPADLWVYTAQVTPSGEAWIGGSTGDLLYSADFGASWSKKTAPFDGSSRLHALHMTTSTDGIAGALHNALRWTSDGGATWAQIPTPLDQQQYASDGDDRIETVARLGPYDLVAQGGHVFYSRPDTVLWAPIPGDRLVAVAADAPADVAYGVTDAGYVVRFDAGLSPLRVAERPLNAAAVGMTAAGGSLYVLDAENGLYRFGADGMTYARPLTRAGGPPAMSRVRLHEGDLWGATEYHLYTSSDGGAAWARAASLPFRIAGVEVLARDSVLVWDGHGMNAVFDRQSGLLSEYTGWSRSDVVGLIRVAGEWVAYGGRQYETAERVDVAQTFFGGQLRGSRDTGFVLVSRDRGATWTVADEWDGSGVASVFVDASGITLYSYIGSVRKLERDGAGFRASDRLVARDVPEAQVPYVQSVSTLYFEDADHGAVEGWIHHVGTLRYETADGGRTWSASRDLDGLGGLVPVQGGWAATTGRRVVLVADGRRQTVFEVPETEPEADSSEMTFEGIERTIVSDLSADDRGNAVIVVGGRDVFVYDAARDRVRPLRVP